jgi:hypothetical protein
MSNELPAEPPFSVAGSGIVPGSDAQSVTLIPPGTAPDGESSEVGEAIERPAKVMRIGAMIKQLLDEVRQMNLDIEGRRRLREIYERSVRELADTLSPELAAELDRIAIAFENGEPTEAELRLAHAQLVGWLEGLFHGIQATLFAQQMAAQAQLEQMRQRSLPAGRPAVGEDAPTGRAPGGGAYL